MAAADPDIAEEALDLIDIEYEELPAVFDPLEALKPGAPIVHEGINAYGGLPEPVQEPTNRFSQVVLSKGDLERGFAEADEIFEHTFTAPWVHQAYLEPHACMVHIDDSGKVQVWANNKSPFLLRDQLAACLLLKPEQIRINVTNIGGDFGGKGSSMDVPLCYFLAKASGQPVKMVMSYLDEFIAGNPRHPAVMTIRTGVKRDGTLGGASGARRLQQRRLRSLQAVADGQPPGRCGPGRVLSHPKRAYRGRLRLHQHRPLRPHAVAGVAPDQLRRRVAYGHDRS